MGRRFSDLVMCHRECRIQQVVMPVPPAATTEDDGRDPVVAFAHDEMCKSCDFIDDSLPGDLQFVVSQVLVSL